MIRIIRVTAPGSLVDEKFHWAGDQKRVKPVSLGPPEVTGPQSKMISGWAYF